MQLGGRIVRNRKIVRKDQSVPTMTTYQRTIPKGGLLDPSLRKDMGNIHKPQAPKPFNPSLASRKRR